MATLRLAIDARELRREVAAVKRELEALKREFSGATKSTGELDQASRATGRATAFLGGHLKSLLGIVAGYITVRRTLTVLKDFEAGLVGVAKTSDLAGKELDGLAASIIDLSLKSPAGTKELLAIAQAAGQLGVKGADNILAFTETIAKLGSATNLQGEEAATTLARILNVMGEAPAQVRILGSVITALGNNFAATESEIARHANQVALSTSVYAIGSTRAAAFGVTLAALGVRAELAGSAIGRVFRAIDAAIRNGGQALEALTILTRTSANEIERLFREDPTAVIVQFLEGLRQVVKEGGSAAAVLETFGLEGEEVLKVLPTLAKNVELLSNALRISNKESVEANALNEEVARASQTLAARWRVLGNTLDAVILRYRESTGPLADLVKTLTDAVRILFRLEENLKSSSAEAEAFAELFRSIGVAVLFVFQQINNVVAFIRLAINGLVSAFQFGFQTISIIVDEIELLVKKRLAGVATSIPNFVVSAMKFSFNPLLATLGEFIQEVKTKGIGESLAREAALVQETGLTDVTDRIRHRLGTAYDAIIKENRDGFEQIMDQTEQIDRALKTLGNLDLSRRPRAEGAQPAPLDVLAQVQERFGVSQPSLGAPFAEASASLRGYAASLETAAARERDLKDLRERALRFAQAFKTDQDAVNEALAEANELHRLGAISGTEFQKALALIREEQERINEQLLRQSTTLRSGIERFWTDYKRAATDAAATVEGALKSTFGAAENALGDFLTRAKTGDEIIRDFGNNVVREISRIISRLLIMVAIEGLSSIIGGLFAPTKTTAATSTAGTFASSRGIVDSFAGSSGLILPSAAEGAVLKGPRSGFLAVLHGTERVDPLNPVTKEPLRPTSAGGGVTLIQNINISTIDSKSFDERALESLSRNLEAHGFAIAGEFNRNPRLRDRFTSRRT